MASKIILATTIATLAFCADALSQEPVQGVPDFELIGTREVNEVKGSEFLGGVSEWRMTDPSEERGLVISIRATFPAGVTELDSSGLELSYSTSGREQRVPCLGVTLQGTSEKGGLWFLTDPGRGASLNLSAQEGNLESSFLYAVPPTVSEVSLAYRGQVVLRALPLTWK